MIDKVIQKVLTIFNFILIIPPSQERYNVKTGKVTMFENIWANAAQSDIIYILTCTKLSQNLKIRDWWSMVLRTPCNSMTVSYVTPQRDGTLTCTSLERSHMWSWFTVLALLFSWLQYQTYYTIHVCSFYDLYVMWFFKLIVFFNFKLKVQMLELCL
jgi:hypothetical protein